MNTAADSCPVSLEKCVVRVRNFCAVFTAILLVSLAPCLHGQTVQRERIEIDARAQATPFPHFWEQMFGSGRAILTLRESYRDDLRAVKTITDFRYIRFHAILHDEVGIYNEDEHGEPFYNYGN